MVLTVEETSNRAWTVAFSLPVRELQSGIPFSIYAGAWQQQAPRRPFLSRNEEVLESTKIPAVRPLTGTSHGDGHVFTSDSSSLIP